MVTFPESFSAHRLSGQGTFTAVAMLDSLQRLVANDLQTDILAAFAALQLCGLRVSSVSPELYWSWCGDSGVTKAFRGLRKNNEPLTKTTTLMLLRGVVA